MQEGAKIIVIQPTIEGSIKDSRYDKKSRQLEHLIEFEKDGEVHTRWFLESQLEEVK